MIVRRLPLLSVLAATAVAASFAVLGPADPSAADAETAAVPAAALSPVAVRQPLAPVASAAEISSDRVFQFRQRLLRQRTATVNVRRAQLAAPAAPTLSTEARALVVEQAEWTLRAVFADGAIANYPDRQRVDGYLGSFAAWGLARATAATGDARYAAAAWRWAEWYAAHMDARGFVTDYEIDGSGVLRSTGKMDSTDAYAGLFIVALDAASTAAPDANRLRRLSPAVTRALDAMQATMQSHGLTGATPEWPVAYLMDQAEVYAGMRAAVAIGERLNDRALADRARREADSIKGAIDRLWNPATQAYDWAVHPGGERKPTDWGVLYPDAMQQTWAVTFGLATGERAAALIARLQAEHPQWSAPASTSRYDSGTQTTGYWPMTLTAMRAAGQTAAVPATATGIAQAGRSGAFAWPYTTAIAGQVVLGLTG